MRISTATPRTAVAALVLLATLVPGSAASAERPSAAAVELRLSALINADRAQAGLSALRVDVRLLPGVRDWSGEQARRGGISHDPHIPEDIPPGATTWAENVGMTTSANPADELHRAFMASSSHRSAILDRRMDAVGIGIVYAGDRTYATERFTAGTGPRVSPAVQGAADLAHRLFAGGTAARAVVVRDDAFPDALAAGPLAGAAGPVLLTPPGPALHPAVRATLEDVLAPGGVVHLIGGENALPAALEHELRAAGWTTVRVTGRDRVEAAAGVARAIARRDGPPETVLVATAGDWPDAAAGAAFGARIGAPLLLTAPDRLSPQAAAVLRELAPARVIALGGRNALSDAVVREAGAVRIAAADRQGTAALVAREVWGRRSAASSPRWAIAPDAGDGWTWALAAAPLSARLDAPLLLANDPVSDDVRGYLTSLGYEGGARAELAVHGPVAERAITEIAALVD